MVSSQNQGNRASLHKRPSSRPTVLTQYPAAQKCRPLIRRSFNNSRCIHTALSFQKIIPDTAGTSQEWHSHSNSPHREKCGRSAVFWCKMHQAAVSVCHRCIKTVQSRFFVLSAHPRRRGDLSPYPARHCDQISQVFFFGAYLARNMQFMAYRSAAHKAVGIKRLAHGGL